MIFINECYQSISEHKILILCKLYWKREISQSPVRYYYNLDTKTTQGESKK